MKKHDKTIRIEFGTQVKVNKRTLQPYIELLRTTIDDNGEEHVSIDYLSPYRYSFQINETERGVNNLATSEVMCLGNIVAAMEYVQTADLRKNPLLLSISQKTASDNAKKIFKVMISDCLHDYCKKFECSIKHSRFTDEVVMKEFIDKSYDWVDSMILKVTSYRSA